MPMRNIASHVSHEELDHYERSNRNQRDILYHKIDISHIYSALYLLGNRITLVQIYLRCAKTTRLALEIRITNQYHSGITLWFQ